MKAAVCLQFSIRSPAFDIRYLASGILHSIFSVGHRALDVCFFRYLTSCIWLMFLACGLAIADTPLKVICASRAEKPPVIDGVIDDACWQTTEIRRDFSSAADSATIQRLTTMRWVYDDDNLYLGLEFYWDNVNILKLGIAAILDANTVPLPDFSATSPTVGITDISNYRNVYGVELFIDPCASHVNYYQILFNAAGQYTGNFKGIWKEFKGGQRFKATIQDNRWVVEFVYPAKGLKAGNEWGMNLARNDESYYGIWRQTGSDYFAPTMFGRIVIGSYAEWWNAVWIRGANARLGEMDNGIRKFTNGCPYLGALYAVTRENAERMQAVAERHPPDSRNNFEVLYRSYCDFRKCLSRLSSAYETLERMNY